MPLFSWKKSAPSHTTKKPLSPTLDDGKPIVDVAQKIREAEKILFQEQSSSMNYSRTSRLSKTLEEILNDKSALGYFIQFMDSRHAMSLIKFWLDAESFRTAALTRSNDSEVDSGSFGSNEDCDGSKLFSEIRDSRELEGRGKDSSNHDGPVLNSCDNNDVRTTPDDKKLQRNICDDAVRIYQRYVARDATYPIPVTEDIRSLVVNKICGTQSSVSADCFLKAQESVKAILEKDYLLEFLNSEFHSKHQIDLLTSDAVYITDLLYNDTSLSYFMEYLEQEASRVLLEMWLALDNFQQQLQEGKTSPGDAQTDAIVLYDRWFSLQAKCPLGFSDKVRADVEENICREGGTLPTCFQLPHKIVFLILEKYYLTGFMESPLFMQYLMELMRSIQTRSPPAAHRQRSDSTSTSSSVSEINKVNDVIPKSKGLSFGHVTKLGRFETSMEPMPCGAEENSKFSKAVKKLLHKEENKDQEDAAWKIAERIVRDVTSVTMGDSLLTNDSSSPFLCS